MLTEWETVTDQSGACEWSEFRYHIDSDYLYRIWRQASQLGASAAVMRDDDTLFECYAVCENAMDKVTEICLSWIADYSKRSQSERIR